MKARVEEMRSKVIEAEAEVPIAMARNRWEFLFIAAPLRIPGGTGSPLNPIAIFLCLSFAKLKSLHCSSLPYN
jgi:hypothetical protein